MMAIPEVQALPLKTDEHGVIRVAGTRVTLDTVFEVFNDDASAEEISHRYPTVSLADAYAVISYYLHNKAEVDAYLAVLWRTGRRVEIQASPFCTAIIRSPTHPRARLVFLARASVQNHWSGTRHNSIAVLSQRVRHPAFSNCMRHVNPQPDALRRSQQTKE